MSEPYLVRLANRLATGLGRMEADRRERHRAFIVSRQQADGGFLGREGDSDLYYTSFAVRTLGILNVITPDDAQRIDPFVRSFDVEQLNAVDLVNWLYLAMVLEFAGGVTLIDDTGDEWAGAITARLERTRTADGGYARSEQGSSGSTYHTFMVALTYELLGRDIPQPDRLVQFLYDRQRDDGGFVEIGPMRRSGTNPTAAAVALLNLLGAFDDELRADVREFLTEVRSSEGGFQANTRIPFADGLSTFTGLLTAQDLGLTDIYDAAQVESLVRDWLEFPTGGCRGASWDEQADVEYTFYGLGILGLLWSDPRLEPEINR